MGHPELVKDPRFITNRARVVNQQELLPMIEAFAAQCSSRELADRLDASGVPNAPVQTIEKVLQDPQTIALGIVQAGPDGALPTIGLPLRFDGARPDYRCSSPALGAHNAELLPNT